MGFFDTEKAGDKNAPGMRKMFLWTGHFAQRPNESEEDKTVINVTKLTPLPNDKFKPVAALNKDLADAVSFQYLKRNGWYLTCKNKACYIEPRRRTVNFEQKSSFFPLINLWFDGYTVFESTVKAGWYLRKKTRRIILEQYDGTLEFKYDASFKVNKTGTEGLSGEFTHRPLIEQTSDSSPTYPATHYHCQCNGSISDIVSQLEFNSQENLTNVTECSCNECETIM